MPGYAICTEPRSGSTLLCRLLESTGVTGRPTEFFNLSTMRGIRGIADYPESVSDQLDIIPRLGATPNGVYGFKLFSRDAQRVAPADWTERLPDLTFVYLERLDILGQALSHVRSLQTGKWSSRQTEQAKPYYDRKQIDDEVARLLNAGARWRYFFARNGLPVLTLFYEQMVQAPQAVVDAIAQRLGVTEKAVVDLGQFPHMTIQRDGLTDEWRARFIAESRDPKVFP